MYSKSINKEELHSIFKEIANKNELEFNKLYDKYKNLVYAIAFSILKNKEDSEDVTQKVFLKIWKIEKDKLPTENEASWLYTITKNETLNFLRNKKQELNFDDLYYINSEDKELNNIIEQDKYNRIMSKLNVQEQEIVSLKILSNLSFKEISQILNIPIGTVQWKYYKALHTLKMLLSNLSMFLITIIAFVVSKTNNKSKEIDMQNKVISEDTITKKPEEDTTEATSSANKDSVSNENQAFVEENKTIENIVVEEKETIILNNTDIGILSLSAIFLIITITFSIIYIKHQQKARKKVSK
jgi:RNA polymerase sigma-70 factor (ECF subfamily)